MSSHSPKTRTPNLNELAQGGRPVFASEGYALPPAFLALLKSGKIPVGLPATPEGADDDVPIRSKAKLGFPAAPDLEDALRLWTEREARGGFPPPSLPNVADPIASFLAEIADHEGGRGSDALAAVAVPGGVEIALERFDASDLDASEKRLQGGGITLRQRDGHVEKGLPHQGEGDVGRDADLGIGQFGHAAKSLSVGAGGCSLHSRRAQASLAYKQNAAEPSDAYRAWQEGERLRDMEAVEDALRASPDFAPVFAEPDEMRRRERDEEAAEARLHLTPLAAFSLAALVVWLAIGLVYVGVRVLVGNGG